MATIKFGTDGWRAITDKDFNEENLILVTKAIANYVYETYGQDKLIIIGYDPRNKADLFSKISADILSELGFTVYYSKNIIPTPVLAYNAKHLNACALMFTASHNPPEYMGLKFIPDYAGPAETETTDKIVSFIGKPLSFSPTSSGKLVTFDFFPDYLEHLKSIIDFNKISTLDKTVIFDGLYSAAVGYFDKILANLNLNYKTLHLKHDKNFGGLMPDPKPKYLKELIAEVKNTPNSIGLSNDGDSDRFGVINERGEYVSPNEIISILLMYLKKYKNYSGKLIKTVGGSLLLDKIAEYLGVEVIETPVGFKHVGKAMRENDFIIGGEESGGLSIQSHIPEKDGILANLLILEVLAATKIKLTELQNELKIIANAEFINDRIDLPLSSQDETIQVIEKFKNTKIDSFEPLIISKKDTKDGVKIYFSDTTTWILIRPSGTEPLLRCYIETDSEKKLEQLKSQIKNMI
ncbi:phosphoglucomutase/phosphomannomutase family protein [bacterium]|nr:phosphoglucomutase/phosphomannomutase family protein [bacterium]